MASLNKKTSELMQEVGVHACTDVTGFGLLGHACQLVKSNQISIKIRLDSVPFFAEVDEFAKMGLCPAGLYRNKEYYFDIVGFSSRVPDFTKDVLFDPQTSGGLLISLAPEAAELLMVKLKEADISDAAIIGEVITKPPGKIFVE